MYQFLSYSFFLGLLSVLALPLIYSVGIVLPKFSPLGGGYFLFDSLSFYLVLLVLFLGLYSVCSVKSQLSKETLWFLFLSLFFSMLCFSVNHAMFFWFFYELSMLPLLYLMFRDSPYSERFMAGWYFSVYLLMTSLPLMLVLFYLSFIKESFIISSWSMDYTSFSIYVVLAFMFFTKVPLSPFHTWLPIVHAEATSIVSIFLSGYIMKLGLLGVYRCTPFLFQGWFLVYLFICCLFSVFFIVTASGELDGKRWLAFLSLSHMVVPFLGFFVCSAETVSLAFLFCLGHGLSAGLVFGFLWLFYDMTNSRNWLVLKSGISGNSLMFIVVLGLLSLCSFPPTIQFFCEVFLVSQSCYGLLFLLFWSFYLFFGGLVPLVLCGHLLMRTEGVEASYNLYAYVFYFFYLILWCYLGMLLL